MTHRRISAVMLTLCAAAIVFALYHAWHRQPDLGTNTSLVGQFEEHCRIVEASPFEDKSLGLRFNFTSNLFVCDYRPAVLLNGRELFLLTEDAFNQTTSIGFTHSIVAEILVNVPDNFPYLPGNASAATSTSLVAGVSTTVEVLQPPGCTNEPCPQARIAHIEHHGDRFVIEEFRPNANLLTSLEFISVNPL